jgi:hypothetical protein
MAPVKPLHLRDARDLFTRAWNTPGCVCRHACAVCATELLTPTRIVHFDTPDKGGLDLRHVLVEVLADRAGMLCSASPAARWHAIDTVGNAREVGSLVQSYAYPVLGAEAAIRGLQWYRNRNHGRVLESVLGIITDQATIRAWYRQAIERGWKRGRG